MCEPLLLLRDEEGKNLTKMGFHDVIECASYFVESYESMIDSVERYGGFFVGRYELQIDRDAKSDDNPVLGVSVKPDRTPVTHLASWWVQYGACRLLGSASTNCNMMWDSQWDAMCSWVSRAGAKLDYSQRRIERYDNIYLSGSNVDDVRNNIFDLDGNAFEFTQGGGVIPYVSGGDVRSVRGGYYYGGYVGACAYKSPSSYTGYNYYSDRIGSRPTLYIK